MLKKMVSKFSPFFFIKNIYKKTKEAPCTRVLRTHQRIWLGGSRELAQLYLNLVWIVSNHILAYIRTIFLCKSTHYIKQLFHIYKYDVKNLDA